MSPPVPPPGELDETMSRRLILAHWPHYVRKWRRPQYRKYITHCSVVREGQATALSCIENSVKFGNVVFEMCERTERHTEKQTDIRYTDRNTSPTDWGAK